MWTWTPREDGPRSTSHRCHRRDATGRCSDGLETVSCSEPLQWAMTGYSPAERPLAGRKRLVLLEYLSGCTAFERSSEPGERTNRKTMTKSDSTPRVSAAGILGHTRAAW